MSKLDSPFKKLKKDYYKRLSPYQKMMRIAEYLRKFDFEVNQLHLNGVTGRMILTKKHEGHLFQYNIEVDFKKDTFETVIALDGLSTKVKGWLKSEFSIETLMYYTEKLLARAREKWKIIEIESKLLKCLSNNLIEYEKIDNKLYLPLEQFLYKKVIDKKVKECIKKVGENNILLLLKQDRY